MLWIRSQYFYPWINLLTPRDLSGSTTNPSFALIPNPPSPLKSYRAKQNENPTTFGNQKPPLNQTQICSINPNRSPIEPEIAALNWQHFHEISHHKINNRSNVGRAAI
uniref:(northern house mosquito) hypothetical protein n=1 Tax=Culex pipiens TaxID=7175 RepID=A0A8D8JTN4_CULPI